MLFGRLVLFLLFMVFWPGRGYGQEKVIQIKGRVLDSTLHTPIASATTTIYIGRDSAILKYGFTNNYGTFKFDDLSLDTTMVLMISHIGYQPYRFRFRLTQATPQVQLPDVLLSVRITDLQEVNVSVQRPPIIMKGDTLIVNAEAFKTRENAVVEDVLRKVPGIIVWADGKISVNGKAVSKLMVNGKPFFGDDPVIAIRNLPKQAIDKIKIYDDKTKADKFDNDPKVIMDVTLKKGIEGGIFGKAGGSLGTDSRHEGNLAFNTFSRKNQLSVIAAINNTNKEIFNVESMLRQTVYKPGGSDNASYLSNFGMEGLNDFRASGLKFDRDWSPAVNTKSEYFSINTNNTKKKNIDQVTALEDGYLLMKSEDYGESSKANRHFSLAFGETKKAYEFRVEPFLEMEKTDFSNQNEILTSNQDNLNISKNHIENNASSELRRFNISTEYNRKDKKYGNSLYLLKYQLRSDTYQSKELVKSNFTDYRETAQASDMIDRQKDFDNTIINQFLYSEVDLKELLKIKGRMNYKLSNLVTHIRKDDKQLINSLDVLTGQYTDIDTYLTNKSLYNFVQARPAFEMSHSRSIEAARNRKMINWAASMEMQYLAQDNNSQKSFQQIQRSYLSALPSFNIRMNHSREGKFDRTYSLKYNTQVDIPSIEQLVPLTDSINQYYVYRGNLGLKKQVKNELRFNYRTSKPKGKGTLSFEAKAGITINKLVDSTEYDNAGRQTAYTANADGHKYVNASISYQKAAMLFGCPIGLNFLPQFEWSENPLYINGSLKTSKNLITSFLGRINYVQNDLLLYNFISQAYIYQNTIDDRKLRSVMVSNDLTVQLSWPRHTTIVSAASYQINSSSYSKKTESYIWNANLYYRLLKNERLELKLSGTDLLRQRKNLIRSVDNNVIRNGSVNNLQQFFMIGLSYYPNQFGPKK